MLEFKDMSYFTILLASLLGSAHCALMCGGFAGIATQSIKPRLTQVYYHLGRLVTYCSLGALAGFLGTSLNLSAQKYGVSNAAALLTGATLIATAVFSMLGRNTFKINIFPVAISKKLHLFFARAQSRSPILMLGFGVFTTLLPCGWLYTYLALAAASGSLSSAVFTMIFFWFGTLPVLLTIGELSKLLSVSLKRRVPIIVSILMLIAGFLTLGLHFQGEREGGGRHGIVCVG